MKKAFQFVVAGLVALLHGAALAQEPAQDSTQVERGEALYQYWCATCHGKGPGHPGTQALEYKYQGRLPAVLEDRTDLTPEVVAYFVRNGISIMPFFRKTEISEAELAAIGAYLSRNTR